MSKETVFKIKEAEAEAQRIVSEAEAEAEAEELAERVKLTRRIAEKIVIRGLESKCR